MTFLSVKWAQSYNGISHTCILRSSNKCVCTYIYTHTWSFPAGSESKESAGNAGDQSSISGSGGSPGGGNGNPLQYSCLGNLHGHRSLAGCSPRGCEELDTTERLTHTDVHRGSALFVAVSASASHTRNGWHTGNATERQLSLCLRFLRPEAVPGTEPSTQGRGRNKSSSGPSRGWPPPGGQG